MLTSSSLKPNVKAALSMNRPFKILLSLSKIILFLIRKFIAGLFKGKNIAHLLNVVEDIPIVPDAIDVIKELKKRGYIVGIISDSYDCGWR